jgi:hypothetical protein
MAKKAERKAPLTGKPGKAPIPFDDALRQILKSPPQHKPATGGKKKPEPQK